MENGYSRDSSNPAGHFARGVGQIAPRIFFRSLTMLFGLLLLLHTPVLSQNAETVKRGALLDSGKAPVYLEFVRSGTCRKDVSNFNFGDLCNSKDVTARAYKAAWLRLSNNTQWTIGITVEQAATGKNASPVVIDSTTFIDEDGEKAAIGTMIAKDRAEMDVVYKNESETGCDFHKKAPKGQVCFRRETNPPNIPLPALSAKLFVAPGQSIVFPVDLTHVKEYVNLYVLYNFSWEYAGKAQSFSLISPAYDTQHRAYFGWFDLKRGLEAEKDGEKPRA
jgi:hypothetical protein